MGEASGTYDSQGGALGRLTVADIMSKEPIALSPRTTIDDAAVLLCERRIGGAAVVDGSRIVGVISKSDLLEVLGDGSGTVERVMTPICFAVRPTDLAMTAVRLMLYERVHRALVVDKGALVGMVTPFDVMRALARRDDRTIAERIADGWHAEPAEAVYVDLRKQPTR